MSVGYWQTPYSSLRHDRGLESFPKSDFVAGKYDEDLGEIKNGI